MIQAMNYRVGMFQRLYVVLAVGWVGFILYTTPADRLKFWSAGPPNDWVTIYPVAARGVGSTAGQFDRIQGIRLTRLHRTGTSRCTI